ncbi:hypothetical protein LPJ57_000833 [Coemansia sp. RSA 486]|nr:hypothetical protein LPJ57_000833 [Coemansia sp. RSA 486]KAJ2236680.1 hypothetical protein IWW45_001594 [Coemansia sp. RSA 485]
MDQTVTAKYTNTITSGYKPSVFELKSSPVTDTGSLVSALEQIQSDLNSALTDLMDAEKHAAKIQKTE